MKIDRAQSILEISITRLREYIEKKNKPDIPYQYAVAIFTSKDDYLHLGVKKVVFRNLCKVYYKCYDNFVYEIDIGNQDLMKLFFEMRRIYDEVPILEWEMEFEKLAKEYNLFYCSSYEGLEG